MLAWVLDSKIMELTGLTKDQLTMRRSRGYWECGKHYAKFEDGQYWYYIPAIQQWQEEQAHLKLGRHKRGRSHAENSCRGHT